MSIHYNDSDNSYKQNEFISREIVWPGFFHLVEDIDSSFSWRPRRTGRGATLMGFGSGESRRLQTSMLDGEMGSGRSMSSFDGVGDPSTANCNNHSNIFILEIKWFFFKFVFITMMLITFITKTCLGLCHGKKSDLDSFFQ